MTQETFQAPVDGGVLAGYVDGAGPPVLVLHGGPGLSVSIVDGLVADLLPAYRVATFQQRGIEPSTTEGVVHHRRGGRRRRRQCSTTSAGTGRTSWAARGAATSRSGARRRLPHRLLGVLAVDPLGAVGDGGNAEFEAEMERRTPEADRERAAELDRLAQQGEVSEELALESLRLFWPAYFADPAAASPMPEPMRLSIPAYSGLFADLLARLPELEASLPAITRARRGRGRRPQPDPELGAGGRVADRVPGGWTEVVPEGRSPAVVRACRGRCVRRWTD